MATRTRLKNGETLYRTGDAFTALYAIRLGTRKTTVLASDGREQYLMLVLGRMQAEERLAAFLLNLADWSQRLGYSSTEINGSGGSICRP